MMYLTGIIQSPIPILFGASKISSIWTSLYRIHILTTQICVFIVSAIVFGTTAIYHQPPTHSSFGELSLALHSIAKQLGYISTKVFRR